jgi:tetratricopeptide (TPR) repeat protein
MPILQGGRNMMTFTANQQFSSPEAALLNRKITSMNMVLPRIAIVSALMIFGAAILFAQEPAALPQDPSARNMAILKLISRGQYQQAADECRALIESHPDFSNPYSKLVIIAGKSGQLDQTERYFERLSETNPRAFYSLGQIHSERGEYQAAIDYQIKCLNAMPGFSPAAEALAHAALALKSPGDAEKFFRSRPAEAVFAFGLGFLYRQQKKYDSALDMLEQALMLNPQLIEAKLEKVANHYFLGRRTEALASCEELLRVVSEVEDPERKYLLLNYKAFISYGLHNHSQTISDLTEVLRLVREYEWKSLEARLLSMIGVTYQRMNLFYQALSNFQQALEVSRAGDRRSLGRNLGNIGMVYEDLRNLAKAAEFYQQAIDVARTSNPPDNDGLANFLINLSNISPEIGRADQARTLLEEATRILGSSSDSSMTYRIQAGWGRYYGHIRNYGESLRFDQAALQIARERNDLIKQGACLYQIGDSHLNLKENTAAITAYQALGIGRKIQVQSIIWKAEAGLARASQQDRPEQALLHFRRAIEAIENVRSQQLTSEERIDFFQNKTAVYQQTVLLLASLHRRDPSKRYDAEAFHMAERARSRALLDSLGETAAHMEQSLDRKLLDRQQEIQQRLSQVEAQMLKAAVDKTTPPDTLRKLEADLLQAVNEYSDWRRQVRLHDPRIADLTLPEPFTLQQVQEALRNGG